MSEEDRVVVTGLGAVTPIGIGADVFWSGLLEGRSGIGAITRFDTSAFAVKIGGEVTDFDPSLYMERKMIRHSDRYSQFFAAAVKMALADADMPEDGPPGDRTGVMVGTGIGGMETLYQQILVMLERGPDRVSPFLVPMMIANMAAGQAAIDYGFRGPNATYVTACASSAHAVGEAFRAIRQGDADVMIAGGSEAAFVPIAIAGFASMKALSTRNDDPTGASRPFDRTRDGFVMGEGAGAVVLERESRAIARGAKIRAVLSGYASTADGHHITAPAPGGEGGARAMRLSLADAAIAPEEIGYINAHGTGTPPGDAAETAAIHAVFGEHAGKLAVSSTKSMTGHLLGASGAVEAVACVKVLEEGMLPPTINYREPDPECDLDYVPNEARRKHVSACLSNSFGFGGQNVSLVFRRWSDRGK